MRLNISLTERDTNMVQRLKDQTGLTHNTEVVRYCITKVFKETFQNDK